ncbi:glycosyltransferase [Sneathiella marina]|uniref:Glycosyltransferase n=1 Tax=Sneathiella marina TaxID=2950108 RepID=A0ABY4W6Q4_9PROT|nr:glycosyltransferase [Sneathiella marina]USG62677.1 glycosyltransferase [Sneathiella marina]
MADDMPRRVLWWGRFDPDYSRNRILRQAFLDLGWQVSDFIPSISPVAHLQALFTGIKTPDLVWVPAFRQRDVAAATRWAASRNIPLIFDPLISAYDKQVFERKKFSPESPKGHKLRIWESRLLNSAACVIADTQGHADFFAETFNIAREKISVIAVGAEEKLFKPGSSAEPSPSDPFEALFYGSFIGLQAPHIIVEAAKQCSAPIRWTLLGDGPERPGCEALAEDGNNINFEPTLPYPQLPDRIRQADLLLGIFGESDKAARVIPNKVYQSLACGKPVVTRSSTAYPGPDTNGLMQIAAGDPGALAARVTRLYENRAQLPVFGADARAYYDANFSTKSIELQLKTVVERVLFQ